MKALYNLFFLYTPKTSLYICVLYLCVCVFPPFSNAESSIKKTVNLYQSALNINTQECEEELENQRL